MKKVLITFAALALIASVSSCRETETKTEEGVEAAAEAVEATTEDAVEAVDAAAEDAVEAVEEAAEEAVEAVDGNTDAN